MTRDPVHLLSHLRAGFRPGPAELAQAAIIEDWQIVPTVGPFALTGRVGGEGTFAVLLALDAEAGWALVTDGWLKLGCGSGSLAPFDEIVRRAELWLAEDGGGTGDEARRIAAEARLLAQRAERAGLSAVAYLLDMAAMEAAAQQ